MLTYPIYDSLYIYMSSEEEIQKLIWDYARQYDC